MKATGIVRRIDELGRIVLPIELRRILELNERDRVEITAEDDRIILRKYEPACALCGRKEELIPYREKQICRRCADEVAAMK